MLSKVFLSLFLIMSVASASDVIDLDDGSFEEVLTKYNVGLVQFMASWCGYCQRLQPIFEEAATKLKNANSPVTLFRVNCEKNDANRKVCVDKEVMGYPTLRVFKADSSNGLAFQSYEGSLEIDGMVNYMNGVVQSIGEKTEL
jgi:thioredoxin domain-containing protein 5